MTERQRQADLKTFREMEERLSFYPDSLLKDAMLDLLRASRLLVRETPDVDNALTAIGMAAGFLATEMGL